MLTRHYLISGSVQGVGFRYFARACAHSLQLGGWVRNLSDGRVEAVATGGEEALNEFESLLRDGPIRAKVEQIEVLSVAIEAFTGFMVKPNGEKSWPE